MFKLLFPLVSRHISITRVSARNDAICKLKFLLFFHASYFRKIQYQMGQLYMIARHSYEQSGDGEGVEVIENRDCEDDQHGKGQYTEKRLHLST